MNKYMNIKQKAVSYSRVSTNLQAERDDSLEKQAARIKQAALDNGWDLIGVYHDVASATGKDSLVHRPGLRDALAHAERDDAFVVVKEPTRLFRNRHYGLRMLRENSSKVYSLKDEGVLSRKKLGEAFRAGEEQAEVTREATSKAMAKAARSSRPSRKASENSSFSRKLRSEEIAEEIADILEHEPPLDQLRHREFAEMLNLRGLRSGWGREWNAETVRNRRARARDILRVRKELDAEVDKFSPKASSPVRYSGPKPPREKMTQATETAAEVETQENLTDRKFGDYRDDPLFGSF